MSIFNYSFQDKTLAVSNLSRIKIASNACLERYENSYNQTPEPEGYRPHPLLLFKMMIVNLLH